MRFHTARHSGEMMTRLEQDASDVALLFHIIAPSALHGGIFLAGSLVAMLLLDWQLAIVAIVPFPVLLIAFRRILPEVSSYFDRLFRAEAEPAYRGHRHRDRRPRGARVRRPTA